MVLKAEQSLLRPERYGQFLVFRPIGRGGMGEVFLARDRERRLVALKRLRPDLASVPTLVARFRHEVDLALKLRHENLVETYEVGDVAGQLYLSTRLVIGKDTSAVAKKSDGTIPPEIASTMLFDALEALAFVHGAVDERGKPLDLLHRDITPGNLIVGYDGLTRLADFGLAKSSLSRDHRLTRLGEIPGTPSYVAPEVIRDQRATSSSDIYGLGAVLYRLLSGRHPHVGTLGERLLKALTERPTHLALLRPGLPEWLTTLIHAMLEPDPRARPGDARALAEQVRTRLPAISDARARVARWLADTFAVEASREFAELRAIEAYRDGNVTQRARRFVTQVTAKPHPLPADPPREDSKTSAFTVRVREPADLQISARADSTREENDVPTELVPALVDDIPAAAAAVGTTAEARHWRPPSDPASRDTTDAEHDLRIAEPRALPVVRAAPRPPRVFVATSQPRKGPSGLRGALIGALVGLLLAFGAVRAFEAWQEHQRGVEVARYQQLMRDVIERQRRGPVGAEVLEQLRRGSEALIEGRLTAARRALDTVSRTLEVQRAAEAAAREAAASRPAVR